MGDTQIPQDLSIENLISTLDCYIRGAQKDTNAHKRAVVGVDTLIRARDAAEAIRESQSLPAGAVSAAMIEAARSAYSVDRISNGEIMDKIAGPGFGDRLIRGLIETALQADAREKGEAVDVERFRELPAKWLHERAEMASARRGHNPHNEGIIATLDRCARELEARLIATQPAQASEKDNG